MRKAWYVPRQKDGKGPSRQQNGVVLSGKELESRDLAMSELVDGKMTVAITADVSMYGDAIGGRKVVECWMEYCLWTRTPRQLGRMRRMGKDGKDGETGRSGGLRLRAG